jgi:hypothetical protein
MKLRHSITALALMLAVVAAAAAQANATGQEAKAVPKLFLGSFTHDFGEVKPGLPLSYSFKIKNIGKADLHILAVQPG